MLRDPQTAFQRLWNWKLVTLKSVSLKCSFPWQHYVCPLMQALALLSPSVNLSSNALFNSSHQEMLQMEAVLGWRGQKELTITVKCLFSVRGEQRLGKYNQAPLACQWWGATVFWGQKDLSFCCKFTKGWPLPWSEISPSQLMWSPPQIWFLMLLQMVHCVLQDLPGFCSRLTNLIF